MLYYFFTHTNSIILYFNNGISLRLAFFERNMNKTIVIGEFESIGQQKKSLKRLNYLEL